MIDGALARERQQAKEVERLLIAFCAFADWHHNQLPRHVRKWWGQWKRDQAAALNKPKD